jgi:cell division protein FtsN
MRKKNKKVSLAPKPFLVLSRRAIAGWLVAIFFVCAWMFAIGVLVGRGTSPLKIDINELQKKLQLTREELKKKEQGQTPENSDSVKDKPELEFYEALPKNREDAEIPDLPSPPLIEKKIDPLPEKKPSQSKKSSMKRQTKTQNKATEQGEAPKKELAEKSKLQPTAPKSKAEPAGKPYTIQVAAFKAAGDADKLVAELKQKGFSAYRKITKIPGKGIWYRVRVGEFKNKAEASSTIAKLGKAGKEAMLVVK